MRAEPADVITVVLVPVMRRPHRVQPFLDSLEAATPEQHSVLFLVNDEDEDEKDALEDACATWISVGRWRSGDYARKINAGYRYTDEAELMFLAADDLKFHAGWLSAAIAHLNAQTMVVGTNDLGNERVMRGIHSTHTLVAREYVDRFGTIDERGKVLHEGYPHTFCDDEFVQTAIARRRFAFAAESVVEHLHPHWNKAEWDDVYDIADRSIAPGRRLYHRRRRLWLAKTRHLA